MWLYGLLSYLLTYLLSPPDPPSSTRVSVVFGLKHLGISRLRDLRVSGFKGLDLWPRKDHEILE